MQQLFTIAAHLARAWRSSRPSSPIACASPSRSSRSAWASSWRRSPRTTAGSAASAPNEQWLHFLASTGAVLLTFLAGAELDPAVIRTKLTEVSVVGLVGFVAPFLGCAAVAHWALGLGHAAPACWPASRSPPPRWRSSTR